MGEAVAKTMNVPPEKLHLKVRRAGKQDGKRYERLDHTGKKIVVSERDLKFLVNPYDFVDTGLFSDHRNTRQIVREMASGKDFLNLYCYTASFSCYAAKAGAKKHPFRGSLRNGRCNGPGRTWNLTAYRKKTTA